MRTTNIIYSLILLFTVSSCIEEYNPPIDYSDGQVVIEGHVSNDGAEQEVRVSLATGIHDFQFKPLRGCEVSVSDNLGNIYYYEEKYAGVYTFTYHPDDFSANTQIRLRVVTPEKEVYLSSIEHFNPCPKIDSIYYSTRQGIAIDPAQVLDGLQIVLDFNGSASDSHYYKYEVSETWEYSVPFNVDYIYGDLGLQSAPFDVKIPKYCWKDDKVKEILLLSTEGLSQNSAKAHPLHFVSTETNRLQYRYSMLVKQMSISKEAYEYFALQKKLMSGANSLYETYPYSINGNISAENDNSKVALGYFYASLVKEKRAFITDTLHLTTKEYNNCSLTPVTNFDDLNESQYPIYIQELQRPVNGADLGWTSPFCFDCLLNGGYTTKPTFWDE